MKLDYNSPVILTYSLISTVVLCLQLYTPFQVMPLFTVYPVFEPLNIVWYFRLFSHVIGHAGWEHLVGNFGLILLVGPILEEKYGSARLLVLLAITAGVTGMMQVLFFQSALMGASGEVFMLILLASFSNARSGHIPLTFILILVLYLGKEVLGAFQADDISQFAHIVGGIMGAVFGFTLMGKKPGKTLTKTTPLGSKIPM